MKKFNEIIDAIKVSQRCQRNWDLSKNIPQEHLDILKQSVINSPTKQNEEYYSVIFITDRSIIEQIYNHTNFNKDLPIGHLSKNPQVLSNLLVVFCKRDPKTFRNDADEYKIKDIMEENRYMGIGIASGQLSMTAALLGYSTGFCRCFDNAEVGKLLNDEPMQLLGIGFPNIDKHRTEHQITKIKFNSFNKHITIKNIDKDKITENVINGDPVLKKFNISLKFIAPKNLELLGKGKEWLIQAGITSKQLEKINVDIQKKGEILDIEPAYSYINPKENSLEYIWSSDNLENLDVMKKYILNLPTISKVVNKIQKKGWVIE